MKKIEIPGEYKRVYAGRWIGSCLFDYVCILGSMIVAKQVDHSIAYIAAIIVIGARQHALGILAHDGAHGLITRNRVLNEILWRPLCFFPFFVAPQAYRDFHFNHHRFSTTEKDPEVQSKYVGGDIWRLPVTRRDIVLGIFKDFFLLHLFKKRGKKIPDGIAPRTLGEIIPIVLFWVLVMALVYLAAGWYFLFMWLVSIPTTLVAFSRLRVWSEHTGINGTHRFDTSWWERFFIFPHNTWCHWEHHQYPFVPFYYLTQVRKLDDDEPILSSFWKLVDLFSQSPPIASGHTGLSLPSVSRQPSSV